MTPIPPISPNNSTFGYSHKLKTDFKKGLIPIEFDMGGNKLTKENATLDHIVPKSQGGKSELFNYALATKEFNSFRGVVPLALLITREMFDKWAKQFENVMVCGVKGTEYTKQIAKKIWG